MDYLVLANQIVEFLKQSLHVGTELTIGLTTHALWDCIKSKFKKPAKVAAIEDVEKNPASNTNWEILKLQIVKALEEDESFRKEIMEVLPQGITQNLTVQGDGNKSVQASGGSTVIIN